MNSFIRQGCLAAVLLSSTLIAFAHASARRDQTASAAPAAAAPGPATPPGEADLGALRKLIENGHAAQALLQLDRLAAQTPVPAGVLTLRGLASYNQGKLQQADAAFAQALQENPADEEAAQMQGLTLFRMGKPAEAIPLLESIAGRSLSNAGPLAGGDQDGQAGTRAGDPKAAVAQPAFAQLALAQPASAPPANSRQAQDKADPHYVLALCYIDTRRYDDARHAFALQYGFPPDSAAAYLLAARMLLRREYLPVAKTFAEKALLLQPQLPLAHALLGEIALAGNHTDEAIAQFSEEQQRNPLEPSVYDRLGDAYSRAGNYPEAIAALQRAVLLEPHATGPYILLGKVMLKRRDAVGAATYLERAKSMDPANYMTRSLLGQAYRAMDRREEAAQELQAAQHLQAASEPKLATPQ